MAKKRNELPTLEYALTLLERLATNPRVNDRAAKVQAAKELVKLLKEREKKNNASKPKQERRRKTSRLDGEDAELGDFIAQISTGGRIC